MISLQTELNLAHLLKAIADSEKQVEIVRQVLAEQRDFEPYTAFKRIDELGVGYIRDADLHMFLKENGVAASENDILYLFSLFDSNGDGRMTYSDFLKAVLPVTNPSLRQRASQRESYYVGKNETLPYDVEWSLARVFEKELIAYRKIEVLKEDLLSRRDFDIRDAFRTIDYDRLGFLDHESLYKFFQRNRIGVSDDDILALLRRIDKDQDNRVSIAEFADAVNIIDPVLKLEAQTPKRTSYRSVERSPTRTTSRMSPSRTTTRMSPSRTASRMSPQSNRKSPNRSKALESSTLTQSSQKLKSARDLDYHDYLSKTARAQSPKRTEILSKSAIKTDPSKRPEPVRESISKNFLKELEEERLNKSQTSWSPSRTSRSRISTPADGYRTPPRNRPSSPTRRSTTRERLSPLKGNEEEQLARTLKNQIELDQDIENLRDELALKSDFNLLDAFKVFDVYGKGYITTSEFEDGLRQFDVYPHRDELYLIVKKFDKDGDGVLR